MSELRFDGKVAVVTGGGRGLGRCHALLLASRGAKVVVNDLGGNVKGGTRPEGNPAQQVVDEIGAADGVAVADTNDVSTPEGTKTIIETAIREFGHIDIIVHNAGISETLPFTQITWNMLDRMWGVNIRGAWGLAQTAWPYFSKQKYGRIVNTGSWAMAGISDCAHYCTAKAAMLGFTKAIALDGAPLGIKANTLLPSAWTRMFEDAVKDAKLIALTKKYWKPEFVSPVVAYLAHESCEISGEAISAQGGRIERVFYADGNGILLKGEECTPEAIRDRIDDIMDEKEPALISNAGDFTKISFKKILGKRP